MSSAAFDTGASAFAPTADLPSLGAGFAGFSVQTNAGVIRVTAPNIDAPTVQHIADTLHEQGVLPEDIASAVDKYGTRAVDAANAVLHMVERGGIDFQTVLPLVASALTLAVPGFGAAGAALLMVGCTIALDVAGALGLLGNVDKRTASYRVGNMTFYNTIPKGPDDVDAKTGKPLWMPWASFLQTCGFTPEADAAAAAGRSGVLGGLGGGGPLAGDWVARLGGVFPEYGWINQTSAMLRDAASELHRPGVPQGARDFLTAIVGAWQAQAERTINGHAGADLRHIFHSVLLAWHDGHDGPTYTFDGTGSDFVSAFASAAYDPTIAREGPITIALDPKRAAVTKRAVVSTKPHPLSPQATAYVGRMMADFTAAQSGATVAPGPQAVALHVAAPTIGAPQTKVLPSHFTPLNLAPPRASSGASSSRILWLAAGALALFAALKR